MLTTPQGASRSPPPSGVGLATSAVPSDQRPTIREPTPKRTHKQRWREATPGSQAQASARPSSLVPRRSTLLTMSTNGRQGFSRSPDTWPELRPQQESKRRATTAIAFDDVVGLPQACCFLDIGFKHLATTSSGQHGYPQLHTRGIPEGVAPTTTRLMQERADAALGAAHRGHQRAALSRGREKTVTSSGRQLSKGGRLK